MRSHPFIRVLITCLSVCFLGQASLAANNKELLVLVGGFGSCATFGNPADMNMRAPFDQLVEQKRAAGADVDAVSACYALTSETLFIETSNGDVLRADLETLNELVNSYVGNAQITMIGQSHGGWTVMMTALSLPQNSIKTLVTIDPVSLTECTSFDWTGSWFGWIFGGEGSPGCTESTTDLQPYFARVKSSTTNWVHFWQDENQLLHASDIAEADKRFYLNYASGDSAGYTMGSHGRTEFEPAIWSKIWQEIK
jgi:hypothetical protein